MYVNRVTYTEAIGGKCFDNLITDAIPEAEPKKTEGTLAIVVLDGGRTARKPPGQRQAFEIRFGRACE